MSALTDSTVLPSRSESSLRTSSGTCPATCMVSPTSSLPLGESLKLRFPTPATYSRLPVNHSNRYRSARRQQFQLHPM